MKWVGLTGGIATGKSTVSRFLREAGVPVVDADELARDVVQNGTPGYDQVVKEFGPAAIHPDGSLNRKVIGEIVFGHPERLRHLEQIIHPRVRDRQRELRQQLTAAGHDIAFYDVPLLFEKNLQGDFDETVVVACASETQRRRLLARDGLTEEAVDKRIASQLPLKDKIARADHVLRNEGSLEELKRATLDLLARLRTGSARPS